MIANVILALFILILINHNPGIMKRGKKDMTSPPDLKGHGISAGPIRQQRPVYVDLLPPCNNACPAGENIQAWLALAQAGKFEEAWHFLEGDPIEIITLNDMGKPKTKILGQNSDSLNLDSSVEPQMVISRHTWFGARRLIHPKLSLTGYSLVGCTVAPGFEFSDFELATEELLHNFSEHANTLKNWIKPS